MSQGTRKLIQVAVPPLDQPLIYGVPSNLPELPIGSVVNIPLGRRATHGYVVQNADVSPDFSPDKVKNIIDAPLPLPIFTQELLEFYRWISDFYGAPLSEVIELAVPAWVEPKFDLSARALNNTSQRLGPSQRKVLDTLLQRGGIIPAIELLGVAKDTRKILRTLAEKGLVEIHEAEVRCAPETSPRADWARTKVQLNEEQQTALAEVNKSITESRFESYLLLGVTGSGKTEIYIEAIKHALSFGKSAMVLAPEIALTPQLLDRFNSRLDGEITVLHSGLSKAERFEGWRRLLEGRSRVAIGARSCLFAPLSNLGLVVVDEEHDGSYKQGEGIRYHGRDLALVRAKMSKCPVILGSATPSLESFYQAGKKRYRFLPLRTRAVAAAELKIEVVDMRQEMPWKMPTPNVSDRLFQGLKTALAAGEQAFVMYNRRGFASYLQCDRCNEVVMCPNCSVTMTLHMADQRLMCHYCGLSMHRPTGCAKCAEQISNSGNTASPGALKPHGAGTESVFEELQKLFPNHSIERLDRDAASDIDEYRSILQRMRDHRTDILVGTQMIAKGHDLPNVTVVGVVDCDVGLHMPDFRAGERIFQLLTQVSGRAGRGDKPGRVILQSKVPNHPSLKYTLSKDFMGFAREELAARKALGFPPYSKLLRIVCSCPEQQLAGAVIQQLKLSAEDFIKLHRMQINLLGPAAAPLEKLKTQFRFHLLARGEKRQELAHLMHYLKSAKIKNDTVRVVFDIDPVDML
jgi:primosomal protein N' (replication factor Y)